MTDPMDNPSLEASLDDLKVIFRVLASQQAENPELETNAFYASLERLLEAQAMAEGVDVDDPAEWSAWLADTGDASPSEPPRSMLN